MNPRRELAAKLCVLGAVALVAVAEYLATGKVVVRRASR